MAAQEATTIHVGKRQNCSPAKAAIARANRWESVMVEVQMGE